MTTEQKKKFIVDMAFYGVIAALTVLTVKYVLVWLAPFVAGFLIAYFLRPVVRLIEKWTGGVQRKRTGLFVIGCFYAVSYTHLDVYKRQILYSYKTELYSF